MSCFDLQGHRGARGLKPENTLPGFEAALDMGVTSLETDIHLTRDQVPVLFHDAEIGEKVCIRLAGSGAPPAEARPPVRSLTLEQLRGYRADRNPDPERFPQQDPALTPAAALFAHQQRMDAYAIPTLAELFAFVQAYTTDLGRQAGKTEEQRARAGHVWFDLEIKRIPFREESRLVEDNSASLPDGHGNRPETVEKLVVEAVCRAGMVHRARVRSFDHRAVRQVQALDPRLTTGVLIAEAAPIDPVRLVLEAGAQYYCPCVEFLDRSLLKHCQAEGIRVIPWTVNDPGDWLRLLAWGVDGITTDYPDRLAVLLRERGLAY
jgi:glycerophosphoryl diester phosphodiesterase